MLRAAKIIVFNSMLLMALLVLVEGLASWWMVIERVLATRSIAERVYTEYDPDLGWINRPSVFIPDMYAEGVYLRTNSQRFRNNVDIAKEVPTGKSRVICAGDSFTVGYGVDNEHAWCELLSSLDPRLEAVNMGQGGYGADQAYLWYRRDGLAIEHNILIFAVISYDFERMKLTEISGYGKPYLVLEDGELQVRNTPVPRGAYLAPFLTRNLDNLRQLRISQFFETVPTDQEASPSAAGDWAYSDPETQAVVRNMITQLATVANSSGIELVFVYLPIERNHPSWTNFHRKAYMTWGPILRDTVSTQGGLYLDLIEPFKQLSRAEASRLFIEEGVLAYPGAAGHYNEAGNSWVAEQILKALRSHNILPDQVPDAPNQEVPLSN